MYIYTLVLLFMQIYAYIGVFWLAFDLLLYHCSPRQGELPMAPRELCKSAKCKLNIGQTLLHLALALYLECKTLEEVGQSANQ